MGSLQQRQRDSSAYQAAVAARAATGAAAANLRKRCNQCEACLTSQVPQSLTTSVSDFTPPAIAHPPSPPPRPPSAQALLFPFPLLLWHPFNSPPPPYMNLAQTPHLAPLPCASYLQL